MVAENTVGGWNPQMYHNAIINAWLMDSQLLAIALFRPYHFS